MYTLRIIACIGFLSFALIGCKTQEKQPRYVDYQPYFDQSGKNYVKTPSSKGVNLDTIVKVWDNLRDRVCIVDDSIPIYNEMNYVSGELIVDVELINEKPPTLDTFLIVKGFLFQKEFVNTLFPVIPDSLKSTFLVSDSLSMKDSLSSKISEPDSLPSDSLQSISSKYLSRMEILADTTRDLLDAENILNGVLEDIPWRMNDSIPYFTGYSNYFLDSTVLLLTDTVLVEVFDPAKVVPQLPFNELSKELFEKQMVNERLDLHEEIIFKVFYKDQKEIWLDMVRVEGGKFKIGNNEFDEDERPATPIDVSSFLCSKFEITNYPFVVFLNVFQCDADGMIDGIKIIDYNAPQSRIKWDKVNQECFIQEGYNDFPVVNVTWDGAQMFCAELGGRLLSEAEWEYAAKGGVYAIRYYTDWQKKDYDYEYRFAGGNEMYQLGWFVDNSRGEYHIGGRLKPNQLGIYDMCGNVWEWCYDKYNKEYYKRNGDSHDPIWVTGSPIRSNRGGSWSNDAIYCRITNRNFLMQTEYNPYLGFRYMRR